MPLRFWNLVANRIFVTLILGVEVGGRFVKVDDRSSKIVGRGIEDLVVVIPHVEDDRWSIL
jgi:hypothetical protein